MSFLASVTDSIKSHIDSRLRSPFAGAFVVAWLIVNWKAVLLLVFSEDSIENRSNAFAATIDIWAGLYCPIIYAFGVTLFFYFGSIVFLAISNGYICLKHYVERRFDSIDWMEPGRYIVLRERNAKELARYKALAAESDLEINEANIKIAEYEKNLNEKSEELANISGKFAVASSEASSSAEQLSASNAEVTKLKKRLGVLETQNSSARMSLSKLQNKLMNEKIKLPLLSSADAEMSRIRRPATRIESPGGVDSMLAEVNSVLNLLES